MGSSRRGRVVVVDVAGPGPGPGQAQGGLAGRALAPGPAPSLATDPGGLETETVPGRGPGLEPGGQEAAAVHKDSSHPLRSRISGTNASLDYFLSKTIDSV